MKNNTTLLLNTNELTTDPNAPEEIIILPPAAAPHAMRDFGGTLIPPRNDKERKAQQEYLRKMELSEREIREWMVG